MDELARHDERLPDCDCHECAIHERNRLRTENAGLKALVLEAITDYIEPELMHEQEVFKGHERCSNIPGLQHDLQRFKAALQPPNAISPTD